MIQCMVCDRHDIMLSMIVIVIEHMAEVVVVDQIVAKITQRGVRVRGGFTGRQCSLLQIRQFVDDGYIPDGWSPGPPGAAVSGWCNRCPGLGQKLWSREHDDDGTSWSS